MAEAPRSMCVRQVGGQETMQRNLFTVVLADRTFPIAMHLWRDQRVGHVDMLTEHYERLTAGQTLLVRFEDVLVKRVAIRRAIGAMLKFQTGVALGETQQ